jgi:hypothetical protein
VEELFLLPTRQPPPSRTTPTAPPPYQGGELKGKKRLVKEKFEKKTGRFTPF